MRQHNKTSYMRRLEFNLFAMWQKELKVYTFVAPFVQTFDSITHCINHYPEDKY